MPKPPRDGVPKVADTFGPNVFNPIRSDVLTGAAAVEPLSPPLLGVLLPIKILFPNTSVSSLTLFLLIHVKSTFEGKCQHFLTLTLSYT